MKEQILNISALPSPTNRYTLDRKLGTGIFGEVYRALDNQAGGKNVAIKLQVVTDATEHNLQDEYKILRDFTKHENVVDFYGVYCERLEAQKVVWFVLELCERGSVLELVKKIHATDRKMSEDHIAFVLKSTIKALIYLHENKIMHRNLRCSNILLTKDGEVKLSDFGLSCQLAGTLGKRHTYIGSPSWLAPEVVTTGSESGYGNRADVWALGITAIELADGKAPFQEMHPTRAMFQIVRNPPPGLSKPSFWSIHFNDFISECLEKNPEHRPFAVELIEHPFIGTVPENDFHLTQELKKLMDDLSNTQVSETKLPERIIKSGLLKTEGSAKLEPLYVEDLAALEILTEDTILTQLEAKMLKGQFQVFVGDILLTLNPNTTCEIYNEDFHKKYEGKSRSDCEPHIFAVADSAYQDALHHKESQYVIFTGESGSGKTTNMLYALNHLTHLGLMKNNTAERIRRAANVVTATISAATNINPNSTRAIFQAQVTYGSSGKLSGAIFWVYQLEKWRIFSTDLLMGNFNLLYYFYDYKEAEASLEALKLEKGRKYRYLKITEDPQAGHKGARFQSEENIKLYKEILENLRSLDWENDEIAVLENVLAAILLLGNVRFKDGKFGAAEIENSEEATKVAELLAVDGQKFLWSLVNYCFVEKGTVVKRNHSTDEARDARDMLACTLYKRLSDWIVNLINLKLSFGRSVFGDSFCVNLIDFFGFECFQRNKFEQLIANTTNEQIQFLYNQRIFAWELQEQEEEEITDRITLRFYDNKSTLDQLMGRPTGLFYIVDEASRSSGGQEFVMSQIKNSSTPPFLKLSGSHEFSVAHYAGRINYDAREMPDKNKDFLPPEMIETMRTSGNKLIKLMFRNKLSKTGSLTAPSMQPNAVTKSTSAADKQKTRKFNTISRGQYSQVHRMRTASAIYRSTSLELLKQLSIGSGSGGIHFVRCIRADIQGHEWGFQAEVVRHQLRALSVLDTAKARQRGFTCRIPFAEFIRRYKFLAFDFDETVEETKDNCRLLLIRLKMEGWILGKTKVFLKYYNVEFLQRLYETQVKKIVKIQGMMRSYLVRQRARKKKAMREHRKQVQQKAPLTMNQDEAALFIQKAYRGYVVRKEYAPLMNKSGSLNEETAKFLRKYAHRWRSSSIFQVLLQFRALRYQDLVHFSQQVHIYNQCLVEALIRINVPVIMEKIDPQTKEKDFLGTTPATVWKLPFRIAELKYYDTASMCDPTLKSSDAPGNYDSDPENWDEPLKRRSNITTTKIQPALTTQSLINLPFSRDPSQPIKKLPEIPESPSSRTTILKPTVYKRKQAAPIHYQPPTPWSAADDDKFKNGTFTGSLKKREVSKSMHSMNDVPNPINELKELARSVSNVNDSDDAPFNFQAMLKKTPRNRASMKRTGESEMCIFENKPPPPTNRVLSHNKGQAPKPYQRQDSRGMFKAAILRSDSENALNIFAEKKFLIAPGLIVEGIETDI